MKFVPVSMHYIRHISLLEVLVLIFRLVRVMWLVVEIFAISRLLPDLLEDRFVYQREETVFEHSDEKFREPIFHEHSQTMTAKRR